jgi:YVTN family beta-propeller protein
VSSEGPPVWVTHDSDDTVVEIDASTGTIVNTIPVGRVSYGLSSAEGVSSDGTHVWVANFSDGTVSEIDASTGTVVNTIPVGEYPAAVSSDGTHVWVTNVGDDTVSEIDASTGTVVNTIPVGTGPEGVSSDGTHVWVTNIAAAYYGGSGTVSEIPTSYALPPKASIESPVSGGTYQQGEVVTTEFSCSEGEDGPGIESCTDSNGGSGTTGTLETSTLGSHTYTVTAKSEDGQTGTASISYTVIAPVRCTGNSGTVTLSPGLTGTAKIQTMKIKGTLTGCAGKPFTGATYTATLKTAGAVSCSVLKTAGENATGDATYKWTPKATSSTGTLSIPLSEAAGVPFSGAVTAATHSPLTLEGTVTERFTGGATCGEKVGKKAAKAVKKGTFSGSAVGIE